MLYYVTVISPAGRVGWLLGPYGEAASAEADVPRGRRLALRHDARALYGGCAFGVSALPSVCTPPVVFGAGEDAPGPARTHVGRAASARLAPMFAGFGRGRE